MLHRPMVQAMVNNINKYRFVNCGTVMATGDKQQPTSAKKLVLRDLPNETRNTIPKPSGNSPLLNDRGPFLDSMKVSGTKRQQSSCPSSPARPQPLGVNGTNGHLVYVRRKLETESGKMNNSSTDSAVVKKSSNNCTVKPKLQSEIAQEASGSFPVFPTVAAASINTSSGGTTPTHSIEKPVNGLPVPVPNYSTVTTGIPVQPEPQRISTAVPVQLEDQTIPFPPESQRLRDQHWRERYLRLQMFLKSCDESNLEDYIQKLRSLSTAGRSRHACDLEKRAIYLTLEEGKELHRVKVLNILGKALPDGRHAHARAQI